MTEDLVATLRRSGPVCPAVQLRVLLEHGRRCGWPFDAAWRWSFERVKFPHDTAARREWKRIIGESHDDPLTGPMLQREMWRRAYDRSKATRKERAGGKLLIAA